VWAVWGANNKYCKLLPKNPYYLKIPQVIDGEKPVFQGKRVKRGLYRTQSGNLIQADVNKIEQRNEDVRFDYIFMNYIANQTKVPLIGGFRGQKTNQLALSQASTQTETDPPLQRNSAHPHSLV
jgi:hypothetical protein